MCIVDVPMYLSRWYADELAGRKYFTFSEGFHDINDRWVVTYSLNEWETEIPWMTLYFSLGVWVSIALVHTPLKKK